jgi:hypothetical protein
MAEPLRAGRDVIFGTSVPSGVAHPHRNPRFERFRFGSGRRPQLPVVPAGGADLGDSPKSLLCALRSATMASSASADERGSR